MNDFLRYFITGAEHEALHYIDSKKLQEEYNKQFLNNTASPKQEELKIVIKFEGKTTIASLIRDHEIVKSVKAYCSPCDKFKTQEGAIVAVTRLLEKVNK